MRKRRVFKSKHTCATCNLKNARSSACAAVQVCDVCRPAHAKDCDECKAHTARVWTDGASKGNPGPAGWGFHMEKANGEVLEVCGFLGRTTNNVAEYQAVIAAINFAGQEGVRELAIVSDSMIVIQQIRGAWKARIRMRVLRDRVRDAARTAGIIKLTAKHVLRENNIDADRLANKAMETKCDLDVQRTVKNG